MKSSVAIIWFLLWVILVTESPVGHPGISDSELDYIQSSTDYTDDHAKKVHPPWQQILTSGPVWAIAVAHFTENWGFYTWLTELPSFMTHVLKFHMDEGGSLSALPYLVMGIVVCMGGYFADVLRSSFGIPTVLVRKVFTCGGNDLLRSSSGQWQVVFYLAAAIYGIGGVIYAIFGSATVQPWASSHHGYSSHLDDPEGPE
ncbi:hypothetical protein EGW08_002407 [Elysia chlorotica]|uniref:Major facilitator superfamily (MFS) profile domain-containing protein n=1 Tax=Elysia chlorotica TaxID=188477 RepID=A0A433U7T9_ELYCH|nr:hypothetical protein EGW08_002407 [Elysia chlorotica]